MPKFSYTIPITRADKEGKAVKTTITRTINASTKEKAAKKLRKIHDTFILKGPVQ